QCVTIDGNGKIVVAGTSTSAATYNDFAVVRYNPDGSLDTTFNGTGKVTTDIGSSDDVARSVAIDGNGKIVVAGYSNVGGTYDFALVRYNADGSLDTTLGGTGMLTTAIGSLDDSANGVAIDGNGKIIVAGSSYDGSKNDIAVVRYNADGSLDTTFDGD